MQVDIRGVNLDLTQPIRDHVKGKLESSLKRFLRLVQDIVVRLEDDNGPRRGADKLVKLHAHIVPTEHLIIEERDKNLYAAVDKAFDRLKVVLGKRANKLPRSHSRDRTCAAGFNVVRT